MIERICRLIRILMTLALTAGIATLLGSICFMVLYLLRRIFAG